MDELNQIRNESTRKAIQAVISAGTAIKQLDPVFEVKESEGHRSGITKGDALAQETIIDHLSREYPDAVFLSEEGNGDHKNLLTPKNPQGILEAKLAFIIDPTDGTAAYASKLGTWCIGIAVLKYGNIVGSVVYAPALNGGILLVAQENGPVVVSEWDFAKTSVLTSAKELPPKKCLVAMGVDLTLYHSMMGIVPIIGANIKAWNLANSGILSLTQVACGRLQAIIQSPQRVWDWAPAYRAVLETGNVFRFFRLIPDPDVADTHMLVPVENYDFDAFCVLPKENRLGFVAGEPGISERIFNLLPRRGWSRIDPINTTASWK